MARVVTRVPPCAMGSTPRFLPSAWNRDTTPAGSVVTALSSCPDVAEAVVALLGGEVDHPQDRPVLVPEVEERIGRAERRAVAGRPGALGHEPDQALAVEAISWARMAASTSAKYW